MVKIDPYKHEERWNRRKGPIFKDLRSSMICYLLKNDWRIEEVNNRLGHSPNNLSMVGRYANYLALDKHKPKKKLFDNDLQKIKEELEELKKDKKLYSMRVDNQEEEIKELRKNQMTSQKLNKFASKIRKDIFKMIKDDVDKIRGEK